MRFPSAASRSTLDLRTGLQLVPSSIARLTNSRDHMDGNGTHSSTANPSACLLTYGGKVYSPGERLPCEPVDAHLNGLRRSLQRRVMGLNFPGSEVSEASQTKSA